MYIVVKQTVGGKGRKSYTRHAVKARVKTVADLRKVVANEFSGEPIVRTWKNQDILKRVIVNAGESNTPEGCLSFGYRLDSFRGVVWYYVTLDRGAHVGDVTYVFNPKFFGGEK